MEYICIDKDWKEAEVAGDTEEAIERIRQQIAQNLMRIHNEFSDYKITSAEEVYAVYAYEAVRDKEAFSVFEKIGDVFRILQYSEKDAALLLNNYEKLEEQIKTAISLIGH